MQPSGHTVAGMDAATASLAHDPVALTQALQAAAPMNRTLGLEVVGLDPVVLRLPNQEPIRNHVGGPHAGAIFTAGETAAATLMLVRLGHLLDRAVALAVRGEIEWTKLSRCAVLAEASMEADASALEEQFEAGERPEWVTRIDFRREDDGAPCGLMHVTLTLVRPRD